MSYQKCPPAPKASTSNMNPSWSPVVLAKEGSSVCEFDLNSMHEHYPYYPCNGRLVKSEEIIAPEVYLAIQKNHYLTRQIKQSWWITVESEEEPFASPQDSFLCRRDHTEYEILVSNPTEEEKSSLTYKKIFMKNEMGYFRSIWLTIDYGTTYEGNNHWTRHTVVYLKDHLSPYPFSKDSRPEHHINLLN